jgi:hypothetical protein
MMPLNAKGLLCDSLAAVSKDLKKCKLLRQLTLCVITQSKLNVQANMIESQNGQLQSQQEQPKLPGRFTGERLLRERPRVYRKAVELLAKPDMSINQITKLCRVSEHTVRALRDPEAISIAERKQRLTSIFANVAEIAAEPMEELAGQASLRDAGTTAGIVTDKLLALNSDPQNQANQHLHVHLQPVDLIGPFNQMIAKLNGDSSTLTAPKALPSGPDPKATRHSEATEAAAQPPEASEGCAREEKLA